MLKKPYRVYVYDLNQYSNLIQAFEACDTLPEHDQGPVEYAEFETEEMLSAYMAGVEAVNNLPGLQHFAVVPLEYYWLRVYRGADYDESYTAARADGAVYDTGVKVLIEDLTNKELLGAYSKICERTDHCIHNGQSNIQMLLVNPFDASEFHRITDFI